MNLLMASMLRPVAPYSAICDSPMPSAHDLINPPVRSSASCHAPVI